MKLIKLLLLIFCIQVSAQKAFPISIKDRINDVLIDDFDNLYLSLNNDLSIVKYDSLGNTKAELKLPYPFKIQSVENPLNIFLFSENGQEIKILDQNLNEVQCLKLYEKFSHIKAAYIEDLQYVWLLDSSQKSLIQYNYREGKVINSFPMKLDFDRVTDFLVFNRQVYLIMDTLFSVYGFNSDKVFSQKIVEGRKLRRENDKIEVLQNHSIAVYKPRQEISTIFLKENSIIVEKNSNHFLALIGDKFYLYQFEK